MTRPKAKHANLLRHGYERVAAHIKGRVERTKGVKPVVVRNDGSVRIYQSAAGLPVDDEPHLVGAYGQHMPIEVIEDDCICRLRELSEPEARKP